jgi:hypothetical protein
VDKAPLKSQLSEILTLLKANCPIHHLSCEVKMIECSLRQIEEYGTQLPNRGKGTKSGLYLGSNYAFKGFGVNRWVVGVYIDIDYKEYLEGGTSEEDVVRQCIEFLNQPPPRKKYQKKKPIPEFGTLGEKPLRFRFREDEGGSFIEATLSTDQRRSKKFWGSGDLGKTLRKRGRPRKEKK